MLLECSEGCKAIQSLWYGSCLLETTRSSATSCGMWTELVSCRTVCTFPFTTFRTGLVPAEPHVRWFPGALPHTFEPCSAPSRLTGSVAQPVRLLPTGIFLTYGASSFLLSLDSSRPEELALVTAAFYLSLMGCKAHASISFPAWTPMETCLNFCLGRCCVRNVKKI